MIFCPQLSKETLKFDISLEMIQKHSRKGKQRQNEELPFRTKYKQSVLFLYIYISQLYIQNFYVYNTAVLCNATNFLTSN